MGGPLKELDISKIKIKKEFNIVRKKKLRKHLGINYDFKGELLIRY